MNNTVCLTFICKNEEHCILNTLNSVCEFINYWVICDTGSTDRTCEIIQDFFREKKIPGELYRDEFIDFGYNKTLMMSRCKGKADYILHIDADDLIVGTMNLSFLESDADSYFVNTNRGGSIYKTQIIYKGDYSWKFRGVLHNTVKNLEKIDCNHELIDNTSWYLLSQDVGTRKLDPNKYQKDAVKLQKQFFDTLVDDPDELNIRSIFYTAQSYFDCSDYEQAIKWYCIYTKFKDTWIEELFESHIRITTCMIYLGYPFVRIKQEIDKAISILSDRAEPYYIFGKYANGLQEFEVAYHYLKQARKCDLQKAQNKYILFVIPNQYGKWVDDELSVSCYWTGRYKEGLDLVLNIIDSKELSWDKKRLADNLNYFQIKINEELKN